MTIKFVIFSRKILSDMEATSNSGLFNKYITIRKAVRLPIPGNEDKASTAFSTISDVNCIRANLSQTKGYL
jgi:hypothetical protein